jgi:hypothetical protein
LGTSGITFKHSFAREKVAHLNINQDQQRYKEEPSYYHYPAGQEIEPEFVFLCIQAPCKVILVLIPVTVCVFKNRVQALWESDTYRSKLADDIHQEVVVVANPDTVICPGAMVVEPFDAVVTH